MHENDQNNQDILRQIQDDASYSNAEDSAGGSVSGPDSDNSSDAVTNDSVTGTVETFEEISHQDVSFNVALLFVVSIIIGLLIFNSLSRKWHV